MLLQLLRAEFEQEVVNTRRLLEAIPDSALDYKPAEISWTTAELAAHIATIYFWYEGTFGQDVLDMSTLRYDRGDLRSMNSIRQKFEHNVEIARAALAGATEESLGATWRMVNGKGEDLLPPMPRVQVARGFLFSHLYHHRGEMIVYLRATGNKVPRIYGPTAEQSGQSR